MSGYRVRHGYAAEYLMARTDAQWVYTKCGWCGDKCYGRADEGREWARTHRAAKHPEMFKPKRQRKRIWKRRAA